MKQFLALISLAILLVSVSAFAPTPALSRSTATFKPARVVSGTKPTHMKQTILFMSEPNSEEESTEVAKKPPAPTSGTFYDDEADSAPKKDGISGGMKERLRREASTGLDADTKQTNVLLYIMLGIAALVILGGQGIFY